VGDVVAEEVVADGEKSKSESAIAGDFEGVEAFFLAAEGFDCDKTEDCGKKEEFSVADQVDVAEDVVC